MISLRKDPKGETVFDKSTNLSSVETGESTLRKTTDSDTVTTLRTRIKQLEAELNTYKVIMTVISFTMIYRTFTYLGTPTIIVLVNYMWQSRVEIEQYSIAYFDRVIAFEVL